MAHVSNDQLAEAVRSLYEPISAELADTEEILRQQMRSDYPYVDELVRYGCFLGGKRLRPALLLFAAQACGEITAEHKTLAAVVEMIHTATLVHDDVLDEALQRRHLATVNSRWDNEASVLLGDFLFTHAFYLASTLETTLACRWIGHATNIVCEGELRQKGSRGDWALDEAEYLGIIEAKTAELCDCCCRLGAHYAGADEETVEKLARYGRDLGIAFQIADDILDVLGDEDATGKSLGTDIEKQKPTLPIIRALQVADEDDRQAMTRLLTNPDAQTLTQLRPYLERYDGIAYAREKAIQFADNAIAQLAGLADSPARSTLEILATFSVARDH